MFASGSLSGKQSREWNHTDSPVNKKFSAQLSVKEAVLSDYFIIKSPITTDFAEKFATVVVASFCQILRQYSIFLLNGYREKMYIP